MTGAVDLSGFGGWVPFAALPTADVPVHPGVYVIVRPSDESPPYGYRRRTRQDVGAR